MFAENNEKLLAIKNNFGDYERRSTGVRTRSNSVELSKAYQQSAFIGRLSLAKIRRPEKKYQKTGIIISYSIFMCRLWFGDVFK